MATASEPKPRVEIASRSRGMKRDTDMLRLWGALPAVGKHAHDAAETARLEILAWWRSLCGTPLPSAALAGEAFDLVDGERSASAVRVRDGDRDLWSIRCEDPSNSMPGVLWATEVTMEARTGRPTRIAVREMCRHAGQPPPTSPRVYSFVARMAETCGFLVDGAPPGRGVLQITTLDGVNGLLDMLESDTRTTPVLVLSQTERREAPTELTLDAERLAAETAGIARVVVLAADCSFHLTDAVAATRSVYMGAARAYLPGFHAECDPFRHPLILADALLAAPERAFARLRSIAVAESMKTDRIPTRMPSYLSVVAAAARAEQDSLRTHKIADDALMGAATRRIAALEAELAEARRSEADMILLHDEAEERAVEAELRAAASDARVLELEAALREQGADPVVDLECPLNWSQVAPWADIKLTGRVALTARARRGVRKPEFRDVEAVAGSLLWLATICRDRFISGGGSIDEIVDGPTGIKNAPCGGDAYAFVHEGRRLTADWHVKNGGNTRDPARCLRIYYGWDEATQRIVVADMPGHRRTDAS